MAHPITLTNRATSTVHSEARSLIATALRWVVVNERICRHTQMQVDARGIRF